MGCSNRGYETDDLSNFQAHDILRRQAGKSGSERRGMPWGSKPFQCRAGADGIGRAYDFVIKLRTTLDVTGGGGV